MGCELFKPVGLSAKWGVDPVLVVWCAVLDPGRDLG
jgi:hypothetical protein